MIKLQFKFLNKITLYYLALWIVTFFVHPTLSLSKWNLSPITQAQAKEISSNWEIYDRPDILNLPTQSHNLGALWDKLKPAHFSFVAELLAMNDPSTHIYFLARDSEHLYDTAKLVTQGTADANRIHLLNISRLNVEDPNLKNYLAEHGISEQNLVTGKKVLFVDTGYFGSITEKIGMLYSEKARTSLKTHLLLSFNPNLPSSRAFLIHLSPSVVTEGPKEQESIIKDYEMRLPRYSYRAQKFALVNGRYQPISPKIDVADKDGLVSKELGFQHIQDLKAYWDRLDVKRRYYYELNRFSWLKKKTKEKNYQDVFENELSKLQDEREKSTLMAHIMDVAESEKLHHGRNVPIYRLINYFISLDPSKGYQTYIKKHIWNTQFTEFKPFIEDPYVKIPLLFINQNWLLITNLIDAQINETINKILAKELFNEIANGTKKELQILFIKQADQSTLERWVAPLLSNLSHIKPTEYKILSESILIFDKKDRIRFLNDKLGPSKPLSFAIEASNNPTKFLNFRCEKVFL